MWWIFALLSAFFAALVTIVGKLGLKGVDTTLATTIRSIIMSVSLAIFTLGFRFSSLKSLSHISIKDYYIIGLSGLFGAASWLCYFFALKSGISSHVAAVDRLSMLFIIVLAAVFLNEALTWKTMLGGLLILGGTILIAFK